MWRGFWGLFLLCFIAWSSGIEHRSRLLLVFVRPLYIREYNTFEQEQCKIVVFKILVLRMKSEYDDSANYSGVLDIQLHHQNQIEGMT